MLSRTRVRAVLVLLAVFLICLLGWGRWWWTHPTVLGDRSTLGNFDMDPKPVSSAVMKVAVAAPPVDGDDEETVTLDSMAAHFLKNTAKAHATFAVCVRRQGADPIGVVSAPLSDYCQEVRPIEDGTKLRWKAGYPPKEYVVMTITPTRPGVAYVDAITFSYSRSWRHLRQHGQERSEQRYIVRTTR